VRITQPGAICTNVVAGNSVGEIGSVYLTTGSLYTATVQNYGKSGRGTFVQSAGTTNRFGGSYLVLGEQTTGNGRYELLGGYLGPNGSATEMNVGYNGTGVFYQAGGTLDEIYIDKYLFVGRAATGNGTYLMNGGEILFTNRTYVSIGQSGVGSFIQSNGVVTVAQIFNVGKEAGGRGTYRLTGGKINSEQFTMGEKATADGTAYIEGGEFAAGISFDVGYNGTGKVWQSGGVVTITKQYLFIGRAAGSKGGYVLTGGDLALTNAGNHMYVGEYGNGSLLQSNGSVRVKNWCTVSRRTGSTGFYRMVGGLLTVGGQLQMSEQPNSSARFEIVGTNSVISCSSFAATTNTVLRFEIATNGVSKIAVQNTATLAGKLEVAAPKYFNQPVTIISMGSRSGTFNSVVPVYPLKAVDVTYPSGSGNLVLSNFRYYNMQTVLLVQ
jgi:T5SS/PEP-CTERM-associated repeat protein